MNPLPLNAKQNVDARAILLAHRHDLSAVKISASLTELARLHLF